MKRVSLLQEKERKIYWDNIKGLLIVLVVFAHCLFDLQDRRFNNMLVDGIYYFHMPAFVFVSGYFSKSKHSRSCEVYLKFLFAYICMISIWIFYDVYKGNIPHLLSTYRSEWYLVALIIWRLVTPYLSKAKWIVPLSVLFSLAAGFWPDIGGNSTLAINKIVTFYPFFIAGYLLSEDAVHKLREQSTVRKIVRGGILFTLVFVGELVTHKFLNITDHDLLPNSYLNVGLVEPLARLSIILISMAFIFATLLIAPDRKVPILTKAGRNSLVIFLVHRPFTLVFAKIFSSIATWQQILLAGLCSLLAAIVFGSDGMANAVNGFLDHCAEAMSFRSKEGHRFSRIVLAVFLSGIFLVPIGAQFVQQKEETSDPIYRVVSNEQKKEFENSFRILFCGDLILLEDQVRNAYTGNGYDFSSVFEYTQKYIADADFAIGVFEGPLGGTGKNYSSSNYGDGKALYLNFPDEWADAVIDAGFDLVTLATNHILDMGIEGKERTLDVLTEKGLDFIGGYRNSEEKESERIKIVERQGIKMAVLSYTYGINGYSTDEIVSEELSCFASYIVDPSHPSYSRVRDSVKKDFELAKSMNPDLIIVLPHWGEQFLETPDEFQKIWQENFAAWGADIILGDHSHSVEPVSISEDGVFTLYCPGNYANIYREYNGDCGSMVEVYIDRDSKSVIGGSIIPMWTCSSYTGNYRAVPIYDLLTDEELGRQITTYDVERIKEAHRHITRVMLGTEIDTSLLLQRYYFDAQGFMRSKVREIVIADDMDDNLIDLLSNARRICFVGDSVTEGTKCGGVPWYEPLESILPQDSVNCGWGGATTKILLEDHLDEIVSADADLYVVAVGTNDVRYRNEDSAMTHSEYTENLQELRDAIMKVNPDAAFIFVAPWTSMDGDLVSKLPYQEKLRVNSEYTEALREFCKKNNDYFVNPNVMIDQRLNKYPQSDYLVDYIHPDAVKGVQLYSEAFLYNLTDAILERRK